MASKVGGLGTVVLAGATAACGLLLLGGVAPSPSGAEVAMAPVVATDDTVDDGDTDPAAETSTPTSAPESSTPPTSEPGGETDDSTVTTTSSTTTTTTTTTTTVAPVPLSPVPLSVNASSAIVGAGGVVSFSGSCEVDSDGPRGPLMVWVIGDTTDVIETGVASAEWSYEWTAPTDEAEFGSFSFQFWCGDPAGTDVGYPADLQRTVDMVASAAPAPTTPLVESDPEPTVIIPETD